MSKTIHPKRQHNRTNLRRIRTVGLLETQLKSGVKRVKKSFTETVSLGEGDITRINKEIAILKSRII